MVVHVTGIRLTNMSYQNLISTQVDNLFVSLGELVQDVTFTERESGDYNFATQSFDSSTSSTTTIKGIITITEREAGDFSKEEIEITIKSKDVTDISIYDQIVVGTKTYAIASFEDISGFVLQIKATGG